MEPADRFEAMVEEPAPEIPDDGFTFRVLAALPPRRPSRRLRAAVLFAAATAAGLAGLVALPGALVAEPALPAAVAAATLVALATWAGAGLATSE